MPTIRDVVRALGQRDGVEVVIVLGRDGLPIDAHSTNGPDAEGIAALVPSVVAACGRLGKAAHRGEFGTGIVEFGEGLVVVAAVTPDALLTIVVRDHTNIGPLLYELRRHRDAIAGLL